MPWRNRKKGKTAVQVEVGPSISRRDAEASVADLSRNMEMIKDIQQAAARHGLHVGEVETDSDGGLHRIVLLPTGGEPG